MHEYLLGSARRKGSFLKQPMALSRREVQFEPQKKKQRKSTKGKLSQLPASRLSLVLILTSSRPSSAKAEKLKPEQGSKPSPKLVNQIDPSKFYEKPKSLLEKQYERSLHRFVPVDTSDDFSPLELDPAAEGANDEHGEDGEIGEIGRFGSKAHVVNTLSKFTDVEPTMDILEVLQDPVKEKELHVTYFIHASDEFLKRAHSLVLGANDVGGAQVYYSFVKLALKALHILISEYSSHLNPALELAIYHQLGTVYLKETQALDKAEQYMRMAISLASKHNLVKIKVTSEFLYCQVLEKTNPQALSSFLVEKHASYMKEGHASIADIFLLMRINHGSGGALNSLSLRKEAHPHLRSLCFLYEASTHLYRGSLALAKQSVGNASTLITDLENPPQLIALGLLIMLAFCVQSNDSILGKVTVEKLRQFIATQRDKSWEHWRDDGLFELSISLHDDHRDTAFFEVRWLNSDEFIVLFHYFSGMLDLLDPSIYEQTKKVLSSCLEIINIQLGRLTTIGSESRNFRLSFLTDKIVRLSFIRYSVIYYKMWIEFLHESKFTGISSIGYFIDCFDGDNFTKEEMCYYKLLLPKFLYLAAIYYQSTGDLNAAMFYFLRVRKMSQTHNISTSSLQKNLGLGCEMMIPRPENNELYLLLTLHLALIAGHNFLVTSKIKAPDTTVKSKILGFHDFLSDLLFDLSTAFDKSDNAETGGSSLLHLSYRLALFVHYTRDFSNGKTGHLKEHLSTISSLMSKTLSGGFIKTLSCYMLYKFSTSLKQSSEMLQSVVSDMSGSGESARSLGMLLLSDQSVKASSKMPESWHEVELSILLIKKKLEERLKFARMSVHLSRHKNY